MRYHTHVTLGTLLISVVLVGAVCFTGCKKADETPVSDDAGQASSVESTDASGASAVNGAESSAAASEPTPEPAKPEMPVVKLTETLEKTCLVKVGDTMPEVTLPKLDGQAVSLQSLAGEKLTVVCFWKADHPYSLEELRQLEKFIVGSYAAQGVQVVAIDEDDQPNVAGEAFRGTGATYPCLIDLRGEYFAKVATEELPRTYLLDHAGKILWFDIGYTRSTLRDLQEAIQFTLDAGK